MMLKRKTEELQGAQQVFQALILQVRYYKLNCENFSLIFY